MRLPLLLLLLLAMVWLMLLRRYRQRCLRLCMSCWVPVWSRCRIMIERCRVLKLGFMRLGILAAVLLPLVV